MNVAALISGIGTDALNTFLRHRVDSHSTILRIIVWSSATASCMYWLLVACMYRQKPTTQPLDDTHQHQHQRPVCIQLRELMRDPILWRLAAFMVVLFGARSVLRHVDATLPKYLQRTQGNDVLYGSVYAINPVIIIVFAPVLQIVLARADIYRCVAIGTLLTALAPFSFVLFINMNAAILFMILLSFGEALYSPRLYDYAMALAPDRQEGAYSTLASAPLFLVTLVTGAIGGDLLEHYCNANQITTNTVTTIILSTESPLEQWKDSCQFMWLIIGCIALTTPFILFTSRCALENDEMRIRLRSITTTNLSSQLIDQSQEIAQLIEDDDDNENENV